jgi:hypothetical protein
MKVFISAEYILSFILSRNSVSQFSDGHIVDNLKFRTQSFGFKRHVFIVSVFYCVLCRPG